MSERPRTRWASSVASIVSLLPPPLLGERLPLRPPPCEDKPLRSVWTKVVRRSVWDPGEPLRYPIRDHFGRSGQKWSGRVWGSLASNSKIPSATTSVGRDESGPAECGGHLRAIQRYHPRPLRSVWTKVVRPSVGVTCEQFKDTIRDHFGRSGRKWSGRVWGSLASNSKIPSATTSVGRDESGPAECGSLANLSMMPHPRPLRSVWTKVVRPSVGVTCEQFKSTPPATTSVGRHRVIPGDSAIRWIGWSRVFKPFY